MQRRSYNLKKNSKLEKRGGDTNLISMDFIVHVHLLDLIKSFGEGGGGG